MAKNKTTIRVHDQGLAAALMCCGHNPIMAGKESGGVLYFTFLYSFDLDRKWSSYKVDTLYIKAKSYTDNMNTLDLWVNPEKFGL